MFQRKTAKYTCARLVALVTHKSNPLEKNEAGQSCPTSPTPKKAVVEHSWPIFANSVQNLEFEFQDLAPLHKGNVRA
jgi:hypothetical protein